MAKQVGMKVLVKIGATPNTLAGQRGATLNRSADNIDATSKDSIGFWKENLSGFKEWSIDCDGAFVESDAAFLALETAYVAGDAVPVTIEFPSGLEYAGSAIITDFPVEAPYDDLVTYSISLMGNGALTVTPGA